MAQSFLSKAATSVGSFFFPKTPRGKLRRAVVVLVILAGLSYDLVDNRAWNRAADSANGGLSSVGAPAWARVPRFPDVPFRLGLDLQGGTHLVYVADMKDIPESERSEAMEGVRDVIERRVNAFGVSEPIVQVNKSGDAWRLIVDLAGIKDVKEAIRQIGETPILEFKEYGNTEPVRELTAEEKKTMDDENAKIAADAKAMVASALKPGADFAALANEKIGDGPGAGNGGDIGWIKDQEGDDEGGTIIAAVKNVLPGRVYSQPVKTSTAWYAVKVEEKTDKEVQASHILISHGGAQNSSSERTKDEAQQRAEEVRAKATAENFADLAKEYSDDASNKESGGDLGFFDRVTMVKPFGDAAFAMKDGEISQVVETQFGYHVILKKAEKKGSSTAYHLRAIPFSLKTANDYLPAPNPWKNTQLSGKHIKRSALQFDPNTGEPVVSLEFNDEGKGLFGDITGRNVGQPVGIFLDGTEISVPTVREAITTGTAQISGGFSVKDAKELVRRLNAGALPVPISLESQQSVGASLGKESLDSSLLAGMIGFLVVAAFMILYYRLPGVVAVLALCLYAVLNLALYKVFKMTLSLSGIAGFILSVGMAVDANVLIFERMKEELKAGRPLNSAIDEGFKRAWNSIRDSNFTTLLSCAILFWTSSSLIKGFALTLAVGVLVSMFSAISVSRTLLRLVGGWKFAQKPALFLSGLSGASAAPKQ